ncbi:glutathione S-transferase C-terminal domain-containing protein-like [Clavelina lepadiformis]|uniref:Methyltransferase domain-containing protein n=1 Tax=Clavelina lepadiformis TaxID=159417 RepID=A0ABP0FZ53_CLALP
MDKENFLVFLEGTTQHSAVGPVFNNATQCVCLLAIYCKKFNASLCLVVESNAASDYGSCAQFLSESIKDGFNVPKESFDKVIVQSKLQIPYKVQNCILPAILSADRQYVVSGLCNVLRYLINDPNVNEDRDLVRLLGHKKCCLKSTHEVSPRTKLCEVSAPEVIDNWIPSSIVVIGDVVPRAVKQFEILMDQPVVIHNKDKRQRLVLQRLAESSSFDDSLSSIPSAKYLKLGQRNFKGKNVVPTNDLPPLEHVYVEGVEFMLSDLALLPCIHAFLVFSAGHLEKLKSVIPLTLKWYHRMQKIPELNHLQFMDVSNFIDTPCSALLNGKAEILNLGQEKDERTQKTINKKDLEITLRRDLPPLLERVNKCLQVEFREFVPEEIKVQWEKLPESLHPIKGELSTKRALRKCQQIENLLYSVKYVSSDNDVIVDFCCGGGHVGIVIAYMLPKCHVVLIDNKEESLDRARKRIKTIGLQNITIYQSNLENYRGVFNVGVALHACGVATDMVLRHCMEANSSFVISPCCYGRIKNTHSITYPQSAKYRGISITHEQLLLLGHGGDQTSWNFGGEKPKQGKHCMGLVDMDRIFAATDRSYEASLYSLFPHDCSPKNNLIVGKAPK